MALIGSDAALKAQLKNAFKQAQNIYANNENPSSDAYLDTLCNLLAKAIVTHITANAVITGTNQCSAGGGSITGKII